MNSYFKEEIIEFERLSVGCNKIGKHLKNIKLSNLSNIIYFIILSLQRFGYTKNKKNAYYSEYRWNIKFKWLYW